MRFPELRRRAEALGAGRTVQTLLGCAWGHTIQTPDDTEPCPEQATRIMVIHAPEGESPTTMEFRFCPRHFERAEAETTKHGGQVQW